MNTVNAIPLQGSTKMSTRTVQWIPRLGAEAGRQWSAGWGDLDTEHCKTLMWWRPQATVWCGGLLLCVVLHCAAIQWSTPPFSWDQCKSSRGKLYSVQSKPSGSIRATELCSNLHFHCNPHHFTKCQHWCIAMHQCIVQSIYHCYKRVQSSAHCAVRWVWCRPLFRHNGLLCYARKANGSLRSSSPPLWSGFDHWTDGSQPYFQIVTHTALTVPL